MRYLLTILLTILYLYLPAQQSTFLRATTATSGGGGTTGILDSYTGAAAAYATALLYSGYSGSCLRVRRDSDNAEQDIGFSGQNIDEAAINSFCSGANCFVETWYDQSGNGRNVTQTTSASQPKIYDSSTGIIYMNSIAAVDFDGTNDYLTSSTFAAQSKPATAWTVHRYDAITLYPAVLDMGNQDGIIGAYNLGGGHRISNGGNLYEGTLAATATQYLHYGYFDNGSSSEIAINGGTAATGNAGTNTHNGFTLGTMGTGTAGTYHNGVIQGAIIYHSDQSSNRTAIETAINNYYSIY